MLNGYRKVGFHWTNCNLLNIKKNNSILTSQTEKKVHRATGMLKREGEREKALSNIKMPAINCRINDKLENQFCDYQCNN